MTMSNKELLRRVWISQKVDACEDLDKAHLDKIISQVDEIIKGMTEEAAGALL
jgi:hypothetical protein